MRAGFVSDDVTVLLQRSRGGDSSAWSELVAIVYGELCHLASRQLRGQARITMHTTRLVHDAYLRLSGPSRDALQNRAHFFALASTVMRQVLCDHARARLRDKRGGGQAVEPLAEGMDVPVEDDAAALVAVDEALRELEKAHPRWPRVVECRFFAGLTDEETAEALKLPLRTVQRDWQQARAHLAAYWA